MNYPHIVTLENTGFLSAWLQYLVWTWSSAAATFLFAFSYLVAELLVFLDVSYFRAFMPSSYPWNTFLWPLSASIPHISDVWSRICFLGKAIPNFLSSHPLPLKINHLNYPTLFICHYYQTLIGMYFIHPSTGLSVWDQIVNHWKDYVFLVIAFLSQ